MRTLKLTAASLAMIAVAAFPRSAQADAAGDKVLATIEVATNKAKTLRFDYEVTVAETGKTDAKLGLIILDKGDHHLLEFTSPADMKGTKALVLSATESYVFLPAFGKVRRVASASSDRFLGLSFSLEDLTRTRYSDQYSAVVASESKTEWKLTLTPKSGQTPTYSKIDVAAAKDHSVATELKYYDADGAVAKTETRSTYTCEGDVCRPSELKLSENKKTGSWTKLVRKSWKVDEAMSDDLFTKRNLDK